MSSEYYKRFRPKTLKGVIGQDGAVSALNRFLEGQGLPQALLLTGPSGVGKTTIGRILKELLECGDADYMEINSADFKGIDTIREIRRNVNLNPISGTCRIYLIDEAHKLTSDAQNALLKLLEDTPKGVYFFLATTDPKKLLPTIHTRVSEVKLAPLAAKDIQRVLQRVIDKENLVVSEDVRAEIAERANGSARKALVILNAVGTLATEDEQMAAISTTTFDKDGAFDLAKALVWGYPQWNEIAKKLRALKEEDPEAIRYVVLGCARSALIGSDDKPPVPKLGPKAFMIIDIFSKNFYDSKNAGLAAACWEVLNPMK